jgi:hypothetical protein
MEILTRIIFSFFEHYSFRGVMDVKFYRMEEVETDSEREALKK